MMKVKQENPRCSVLQVSREYFNQPFKTAGPGSREVIDIQSQLGKAVIDRGAK
ncbi:MAG: hypothetical protein HRU20_09115 [Pseudomonadales bacterium]|nr:hypothetical protein [Pseudomonadales bacterium]